MTTEKVTNYHAMLVEGTKSLQFYMDEIKIFEKRLTEVVNSNINKEVLAEAEHFQNQFILQKEQFQLLQHNIRELESKLKADFMAETPLVRISSANEDISVENNIRSAGNIFEETKKTFYQFLSKNFKK